MTLIQRAVLAFGFIGALMFGIFAYATHPSNAIMSEEVKTVEVQTDKSPTEQVQAALKALNDFRASNPECDIQSVSATYQDGDVTELQIRCLSHTRLLEHDDHQ